MSLDSFTGSWRVKAMVTLASDNGRSLMLMFDALVATLDPDEVSALHRRP